MRVISTLPPTSRGRQEENFDLVSGKGFDDVGIGNYTEVIYLLLVSGQHHALLFCRQPGISKCQISASSSATTRATTSRHCQRLPLESTFIFMYDQSFHYHSYRLLQQGDRTTLPGEHVLILQCPSRPAAPGRRKTGLQRQDPKRRLPEPRCGTHIVPAKARD
jgi:hypothetical protein